MQNEITTPGDFFSEDGTILQRGWAKKPLLHYNPENLKSKWRLKEWDFYGIYSSEYGISYFIADLHAFTIITVSVFDFKAGKSFSAGTFKLFTRGKLGLSRSSLEGNFMYKGGGVSITEERFPNRHVLTIDVPKLKRLKGSVELGIDITKDSMMVATGYGKDKPTCFYYNHKWNMLPAKGQFTFNGQNINFQPESAHGNFDWGRGIWPYKSHWFWGTAAGHVDGHELWFNIGYGFGDLSTHTENVIFYDGKCQKIDQILFHPEKKHSGKPWIFTSNDGRFEMSLKPLVDVSSYLNIGFAKTDSNNIQGLYSGTLVLDDGTRLEITDLLGHAEDIKYLW